MTSDSIVQRKPTLRIAIFLIALSATAPISIDMFLPSMPEIADEFGSSEGFLTLGVSLFLVSFAGSQLFYGPASDRWGRRPILFFGLTLYALGGIMCLAAQSAEMLIAGRVLQGIGGGVGPAMGNAMVLDLFDREGATKMIGYQSIVMPLAPAIAPVIGGLVAAAAGWRAVFVVLAAFGIVFGLWYAVTLGETRPARAAVRPSLMGNYRVLFTTPAFVGFAAVMGLSLSSIFLVFTGASIIQVFLITAIAFAGLSLYGYTTKKDLSGFGTFLIMGVIGLIVASIVNIFLASSAVAFAISVLGVLIFAGLTAYDTQNIKNIYVSHAAHGDSEWLGKAAIMGALQLYLDFINMFMFLLQFLGQQRN